MKHSKQFCSKPGMIFNTDDPTVIQTRNTTLAKTFYSSTWPREPRATSADICLWGPNLWD